MNAMKAVLGLAWIGLSAPCVAGTVTLYTDLPSFELAVGPTVVEDFGDTASFPISTGVLNSETDLVVDVGPPIEPGDIVEGVTFSTAVGVGSFFNIDAGGGFIGGFLDGLGDSSSAPLRIDFDVAQSAFGFITNGLMPSFYLTMNFVGGGSYMRDVTDFSADGFFGYASDAADIESVFIIGTGSTGFTFALDDFRFTDQPVMPPVPLPAAAWLLLAGLGGLASIRLRRRT